MNSVDYLGDGLLRSVIIQYAALILDCIPIATDTVL